jgi:aryl-alcohol dehydrogenase-like predicted oxidoreductase
MLSNEMLAGKIRHLGLSVNHQLAEKQIQIALSFGVRVIQVRFNRLENDAAKNIIPFCLANNLGVLARSPLASGFLTGKYLTDVVFSNHDIRSQIPKEKLRDTINFANQVLQTEVPDGISKRQWALK